MAQNRSPPKFVLAANESYEGGDDNYNCQLIMGDHCGVHVDSPSHFIQHGKTIDRVNVSQLIGRGILIDISHFPTGEAVGGEVIDLREKQNGPVKADAIMIFHTGWHEKWARRQIRLIFSVSGPVFQQRLLII